LKERHFANAYLSEKQNSVEAVALRRSIIDGSRKFLEQQCYREIEKAITQNPREAQLGGIPTTINKIRAFIRIQAARKNLVSDEFELQTIGDNDMCWPLIFYLLRCGFVREAADYVSKDPHFRSIDRNFITYLTTYANSSDRRLPRALQEKINGEFQQRSRNNPEHSVDPYRLACLKIVGRCELNRRNLDNIPPKVEDWIWLQFSMAREVNRVDEVAGEVFGLDELCESIVEIGQRHFAKGAEGGPFGTFFLLQVLGGMFEQAIAYLYNFSYVSAVHFAIALDYYGLLRVSDFYAAGNELLTYTTKQQPQINFGRMIGYYTRDFRSGNAEAAVDYLTLICLNADLDGELGKSQASVCHEALRELVLETREFAHLLGDIRSDGTRIKGAIENRLRLIHLANQEEFLNAVTIQAAVVADDSGRTTDAVLLYHLAEDYDNVITIINRALSEAMTIDLGEAPMKLQPLKPRSTAQTNGRPGLQQQLEEQLGTSLSLTSVEDPAVLAKNMIGLYNSNALYYQKIKPANRDACGTLLKMSEAKAKVEAGQWTNALDVLFPLFPLPSSSSLTKLA
jgi:nuclear pore complex protein Nup93